MKHDDDHDAGGRKKGKKKGKECGSVTSALIVMILTRECNVVLLFHCVCACLCVDGS